MQKLISENSNAYSNEPSSEDKFELAEKLDILFVNKWIVAGVTGLALAIGMALAFLGAPIYQSEAMLQVEAFFQPVRVIDQGNEGGGNLKNEIPIMAEIELINSRTVLSEAVKNLKLDISASPKYFPIIGGAIARAYSKQHKKDNQVSSPFFRFFRICVGR